VKLAVYGRVHEISVQSTSTIIVHIFVFMLGNWCTLIRCARVNIFYVQKWKTMLCMNAFYRAGFDEESLTWYDFHPKTH